MFDKKSLLKIHIKVLKLNKQLMHLKMSKSYEQTFHRGGNTDVT